MKDTTSPSRPTTVIRCHTTPLSNEQTVKCILFSRLVRAHWYTVLRWKREVEKSRLVFLFARDRPIDGQIDFKERCVVASRRDRLSGSGDGSTWKIVAPKRNVTGRDMSFFSVTVDSISLSFHVLLSFLFRSHRVTLSGGRFSSLGFRVQSTPVPWSVSSGGNVRLDFGIKYRRAHH